MKRYIVKTKVLIGIILASTCLMIFTFFSTREIIRREEIKKFQSDINKSTHHTALSAKILVDEMIKNLEKMSFTIGKYDDINDPTIKEILNYTTDIGYFNIVGVVDKNGDGYNSLGQVLHLSNKEYFKKSSSGILGISGIFKSNLLKNEYVQILSYPLYDTDKSIKGIVFGAFYFDSLEKLTNIRLKDSDNTKVYLLDLEGKYLNNTNNFKNNFTFWKYLDKINLDKKDIERIKQSFKDNEQDEYIYKKNGITYYGHCIPLDDFNGYLISEIGDNEVNITLEKINKIAIREEIITISCFILMVLAIFTYFKRINFEIKEANKKAEENMKIIYRAAELAKKVVFSYNEKTKILKIKTNVSKELNAKGLTKKEEIYLSTDNIFTLKLVAPECVEEFKALFDNNSKQKESFVDIKINYANEKQWCRISLYNIYDINNEIIDTVGIFENINNDKLREKEQDKKIEIYDKLIKNAILYAKADLSTDTLFELNGKSTNIKLSDFLKNDFLSKIKNEYLDYVLNSFSLENLTKIFDSGKESLRIEFLTEFNGEEKWVSCIIYKINILDYSKILFVSKDIDKNKRKEIALKNKAEIDGLTGIYNSATLKLKIQKLLEDKNSQAKKVFIIIDLDNYKEINDQFGHIYGDKVLIDIANTLKNKFRSTDIIGRLGGDEFIVFLNNVRDCDEVERLLNILKLSLEKIYEKNNVYLKVSGSIGVSISPDNGTTFEELYKKADIALYDVKKHGKNNYKKYTD